ncbi:uncharacterized protein LOC120330893 [Styela clava]
MFQKISICISNVNCFFLLKSINSQQNLRHYSITCLLNLREMARCPPDCKVYVGNLGQNGSRDELEREFGRYGKLRNVWVARNPPGFAFVEFENPRDASDSVKSLDGRTICGERARVEIAKGQQGGGRGRGGRGRFGGRGGFGGGGGRDGYRDGGHRGHNDYNTSYRRRSRSPRRYSRSRSRSRDNDDNHRSKDGSASPRSRSSTPKQYRNKNSRDSRSPSPVNNRDKSVSPEPRKRRSSSRSSDRD